MGNFIILFMYFIREKEKKKPQNLKIKRCKSITYAQFDHSTAV